MTGGQHLFIKLPLYPGFPTQTFMSIRPRAVAGAEGHTTEYSFRGSALSVNSANSIFAICILPPLSGYFKGTILFLHDDIAGKKKNFCRRALVRSFSACPSGRLFRGYSQAGCLFCRKFRIDLSFGFDECSHYTAPFTTD